MTSTTRSGGSSKPSLTKQAEPASRRPPQGPPPTPEQGSKNKGMHRTSIKRRSTEQRHNAHFAPSPPVRESLQRHVNKVSWKGVQLSGMHLWWNETDTRLTHGQRKTSGERYLQIGYRKHADAESKLVLTVVSGVSSGIGKVIAQIAFPHDKYVAEIRMYEETYSIDVRMFDKERPDSDVSTIWLLSYSKWLTMRPDGVKMDIPSGSSSRCIGGKEGFPLCEPYPCGKSHRLERGSYI